MVKFNILMRYAAQFVLILFFAALSFIVLLSATFKFQLLNVRFWRDTFGKSNVYQSLAVSTKESLESQIGKEGGNKNDAKVLTDLITTDNVKDFIDKNLQNVLSFANGEKSEIIVYLPIEKFPKSILPKNLVGAESEMTLSALLTKLNYQGADTLPLDSLSHAGRYSSLAFYASAILAFVFLIFLIILVKAGERLIAPGIAITLAGLLTISLAKMIESLKLLQNTSQGSTSFAYTAAGIILPPVIGGFTKTWYFGGVGLVIFGLILFFIKKSGYNNPK